MRKRGANINALACRQSQQAAQRRKNSRHQVMLVSRGLRNDDLEVRERMAVEAIINGYGTTEHYQTLADMQGVMALAGNVSESKHYARDYACNVVRPVLFKIAERFRRSGKIACTTGEREVLRGFVTQYREFWMRQPTELYEAARVALIEYYEKIEKRGLA